MTRGRVSASVYRSPLRHLDLYRISYHYTLHIYSLALVCNRITISYVCEQALAYVPLQAAQRLSRVAICPLSIPLPSPPSSRAFSAGLSTGCSGGRDAPASGLLCCLRRRTTSTARRIGVRTVLGTSSLARVRTSVGRTWLPEASHCSLGWVSCSQLGLSVYSRGAYCICRPPTQPSPPSLLLRFVWSCLTPSCKFVPVLCLIGSSFSLDLLGDMLAHFRGCQSVLGPGGFLSLYRLCGDSLRIG